MRILNVVGARPNFVKIAPLMREMRRRRGIEPILVHTGQHYDANMSDDFFKDLEIPVPDYNLGVGSGSHATQTARIMLAFEEVCAKERPDLVLVVGDVNSTLASALVAKKLGIRVAHVEAGLRSFDRTMPEEINRLLTDAIADYLFVTEESGLKNLRREGVGKEKVFFVGNVMIDTLVQNLGKIRDSRFAEELGLREREFIVVTLHRPTNVDSEERLRGILRALGNVRRTVIWPVHPRTRANMERFDLLSAPKKNGNLRLIEPLGYMQFLSLVARAAAVVTDSGGIQEETTYLRVPCLTLRENTERPVTMTLGTNVLVGTDPRRIAPALAAALKAKRRPRIPPLWDGHAAERIVSILLREARR
jgi:UDP-N-acetylglucosamine 2-epimerase (non-hydrolysing)